MELDSNITLHEHAAAHGITNPDTFPMDGSIFRFSSNGSRKKNGFLIYFINSDGSHVCRYGGHATLPPEQEITWCNRDRAKMSAGDRRKLDREIALARAMAQAKHEEEHKRAAKEAQAV